MIHHLPVAGSLNRDDSKPFDPDLVTGLGPRHLGDATPLQYNAGAVIDMNNIMIGLAPYLPPYRNAQSD
jgi:hypothetical protein